jgi:hypothetical protein
MLRGKVTAHVIVGGTSHWTLRYHGGFEETVTIDTLNRRLQDRYILDHSGEFSLPNVEPPTTATDLGELRNKFLAGIDSNWQTSVWSKLGYDALHFMHNCQRMLNVDKHSQVARIFSALLSDVLFQIQKGEKKRVYQHLRLMGEPEPESKRYPRSYWRTMAKYTCPDPATIVEGLFDLYAMFHDMDDPVNPGRKVLASNALKILKTEMGYVQKGLLSDIPGMPMYYATGKLSTGFETNRCVRGTPSLEGMHLHYRASQHPGA